LDSAESYRSWLRQEWKSLGPGFSLQEPIDDTDAGAEAVRNAIDQTVGPHGFWVSINANTAVAGSGHGAFLAKWGELWKTVRDRGIARPFAVFLCLVDDEPPAPDPSAGVLRFLRRTPAPPQSDPGPKWEDAFAALFEQGAFYGHDELRLESMPFQEIRKWIDFVRNDLQQRLGAPAVYCEDIDDMEQHLRARDPGRDWTMFEFDDNTNAFFNLRRT
jgi:hypothetical protein